MSSEPQTVLDVLVKARKLIEKEEHWCGPDDEFDGDRECALTAVAAAAGQNMRADYLACQALKRAIGGMKIPVFNDTHTHAEVLAKFDEAIAAEQAKAAAS